MNVPDATIVEPTDAIVRVTRACICGSDLWPYRSMERTQAPPWRSRLRPAWLALPGSGGSLPFRNLKRGVMLGLPSGQTVAQAMEIPNRLTPEEIASGPDGAVAKELGLHEATPLWYYILKEAQVRTGGQRLGPVGARLRAEVFVGIVHGDHDSYLWQKGTKWKPTLPAKVPGTFTMTDLLQYVGDISPIDKIKTVP